jgi:hypothetical protein
MADQLRPSKDYLDWLSRNRDKRGTADYESVVEAAREAYRLEQQARPTARFATGAADVSLGIAQMVPKAAEFVTSGGGLFPNVVSETIGKGGDWFDRQLAEREREYQQGRELRGIDPESVDILRGVGTVANPATAVIGKAIPAATTVTGRATTGAVAGGASAATQPVVTPESQDNFAVQKLTQAGIGAVTGGVTQPTLGLAIEKLGPKVVNFLAKQGPKLSSLLRKPGEQGAEFNFKFYAQKAVDDTLEEIGASPETVGRTQYQGLIDQVENSLRTGRPLDVQAIARQQDFERLGMQPTLGQITRDPRQFATERNLSQVADIGDPLLQRLQQQSGTLQQRMDVLGAGAADEQVAGVALGRQLRDLDQRLGSEVSQLYRQARESTGRTVEVPTGGFASDMGKIMRDYRGRVPPAIVARLNEYGFLGPRQTKVFDFGEADDFIQLINQYFGTDPATDSALKAIRKSVQTAIEKAPVPDEFAAARLAASQRFKLREKLPALEAAITNPRGDEQLIQRFVIRGTAEDTRTLADFLRNNDPTLFNQMKAQIGQYIQRAAYGENVTGDKLIRPESFTKAVRQLGGREKLKAFFTDDELIDLETMGRVASYMVTPPAFSPVNYSGSGAALFNLAQQMPSLGDKVTLLRNVARPFVQGRQVNEALRAVPPVPAAPTSEAARRAAILATMGASGTVAGGQ